MKSRIAALILIVATLAVAMVRVMTNPDDIILHWDFSGNVTGYGPRYMILLLPCVSLVLYAVFLHYEKNPFLLGRVAVGRQTADNAKRLVTFIRATAVLALLQVLYVAACSAQYLPLYSWVLTGILLPVLIMYMYTRKKLN